MPALGFRSRARAGWLLRGVGWLCVLLVLVAGAAHLLHTHPEGDQASVGCSLCAVAHMAALAAPAPVVAAKLVVLAGAPVALVSHARPCAWPARHTIRPPPAV